MKAGAIMQKSEQNVQRVAIIGFGEAGSIFGAELIKQGSIVTAYDILMDAPATQSAMQAKARAIGVTMCASLDQAIADAQIIISAVTAQSATKVAQAVAECSAKDTGASSPRFFLDINSISPDAKRSNAAVIEPCGIHYVDAAVMAPVPPQRLQVPILLGGQHAAEIAIALNGLGMNTKAVSHSIGYASAIKMCRSIMIKGLEALTVESMLTARYYGVEDAVLASLHASFPQMGWDKDLPDYLISRVAEHGRRRAAEVREVAVTVSDAGIAPLMSSAIAEKQDELIDMIEAKQCGYADFLVATNDVPTAKKFSWRAMSDKLRPKI